jgi:hypothetical protein
MFRIQISAGLLAVFTEVFRGLHHYRPHVNGEIYLDQTIAASLQILSRISFIIL